MEDSAMANFVLIYSGGSSGSTDAERGKIMEAWGAWFGKLGDRVVDHGNPFSPHSKNLSNGSVHDGALGTPATGLFDPAGGLSARRDRARAGLPGAAGRRQDHRLRNDTDVERRGRGPSCFVSAFGSRGR